MSDNITCRPRGVGGREPPRRPAGSCSVRHLVFQRVAWPGRRWPGKEEIFRWIPKFGSPRTQTFVEAALKLGGKSEEEARTTGTVDRADDQVDALFAARYQTANSPVHRVVWDREAPIDLFLPQPPATLAAERTDHAEVARGRPPKPRAGHACTAPTARFPRPCSKIWRKPATGGS